MSLEAVQAQAGHRSIESTGVYLHLADNWLASGETRSFIPMGYRYQQAGGGLDNAKRYAADCSASTAWARSWGGRPLMIASAS